MFSSLGVVEAPATEPVGLDLVRQHCRVDNNSDDRLLGGYLTAARMWAEQYLSRVLAKQQLLWVISQNQPVLSYPYVSLPLTLLVLPMWYRWPDGCQGSFELPRQPLVSIDQVSYGQLGQPDTVLTAGTDYTYDLATARLQIAPNSEIVPNDHIAVFFTAGYGGTDMGVLPQPIVSAILMLTAFLFENRGDAGGEMPTAAEMLLTPYRLVSFG